MNQDIFIIDDRTIALKGTLLLIEHAAVILETMCIVPLKEGGGRGWFGRIRRMYKAKTGQRSAWDWIVRSSFPQAYLITSLSLFIYITIEYFNSPKYHPNTYILVISLLHKYKFIIIKWKYKEYLGLPKKMKIHRRPLIELTNLFKDLLNF